MPLVSVVIPVYNQARFLFDALNSVLAQTFQDFEIIVVDDGSTDAIDGVQKHFHDSRIVWLRQENLGLAAARNLGLKYAQGQFLAFLDADDLFLPQKLELQVCYLQNHDDLDLVASGYEFVDAELKVLKTESARRERRLSVEDVFFGGVAPVHAVLLRTAAAKSIGGFDGDLRACEDLDFWMRFVLSGHRVAYLPGVICQYRMHGENMTHQLKEHAGWYLRYLEKVFADSRLSKDLLEQKNKRYALFYLNLSGRYYAFGQLEDGLCALNEALNLDQALLDFTNDRFAEFWAGMADSIWVKSPEDYIELIVKELCARFGWGERLRHRIYFIRTRNQFFRSYQDKKYHLVWSLWLKLVRHDWHWLFDRGGASILLQSLGLRKRMN